METILRNCNVRTCFTTLAPSNGSSGRTSVQYVMRRWSLQTISEELIGRKSGRDQALESPIRSIDLGARENYQPADSLDSVLLSFSLLPNNFQGILDLRCATFISVDHARAFSPVL